MTLMENPRIKGFDKVLWIGVQVNIRRIYIKTHARENEGSGV